MHDANITEKPIKDSAVAHPVPAIWIPMFREIVDAFVTGDYTIMHGISGVAPISRTVANQVKNYVEHYGETLAELPSATWHTSVSQWMGTHWDVIVDLWTVESGRSDLVLCARVFEVGAGYRVEIDSVHVP